MDTSSTMTRHLIDNCNTGGDGSSLFTDANVNQSTLYRGLPAPLDAACMFTCLSTTFDGTSSRLFAAKTAFTNVLNATTKIDWGLMRYSGSSCSIVATFQPHPCTVTTQSTDCTSKNCVGNVCHGTTSFDCPTGEVLNNGVCGTDTNLCHPTANYQETNCSITRLLSITYTGGCGTSAVAGSSACATFQTCNVDADCSGARLAQCALLPGSAAKTCQGGGAFSACPPGYTAVSGRCVYNLACQSSGGVILSDPTAANSASTALTFVDGVEDYTANSGLPANPELRADGPNPLAGAIRSATQWYAAIKAANDPSIFCRPFATVLIVNGADTCDANSVSGPIAAAQGFVASTAAGAAHLNTVHVIALGFAAPDASLNAIAHAGGTTVHYVNTESQIESALNAIVASLVPAASVSGSTTVCSNGTAGTATLTNATAWGYRTVSGGTVTAIPGATSSTYLIKGSDFPGGGPVYLVAGSCNFGSVSDEIPITVLAAPSATIGAPSKVIAGVAATASVPDAGIGASYTWVVTGATFTGQGTRSISFTAGPPGSVDLMVTVQSGAGCTSTGNQSITIGPSFTDDPLVVGSTVVKALHLAEVRDAVNAFRARAALGAVTWGDAATPGLAIKATHIIELRNALTPALSVLNITATYTDPSLGQGDGVKAIHIQEIREYTR